jgi:hypothetical protein
MVAAGMAALMAVSVPVPSDAGCATVARTVRAGQTLVAADLGTAAACPAFNDMSAVRYDRTSSSLRAVRDLAAGDVIAPISQFTLADIRPGQLLYLHTQVGPVRIERTVVALQPGHVGGRIFVKAADGDIFPVMVKDVMQ